MMSKNAQPGAGNDELHKILGEILVGLKEKFIHPVLSENNRLLNTIEEMRKVDQAGIEELKDRVIKLEQKIDETPLLVLTSIRDAINQASGGA